MAQRCQLPDGRTVDLSTSSGADTLVRAVPKFFHDQIRGTLDRIRACIFAGGAVRPSDMKTLIDTYGLIGVVIEHVSPKVFQEVVSLEDMDVWVQHVGAILEKLTQDPRWIRTGVLVPHDQRMFEALTPTVKHYDMVQRMRVKRGGVDGPMFLNVLAHFIQARRAPQLPCVEVADQFLAVTNNTLVTLQRHYRQQFLKLPHHKPMSDDEETASDQAFRPLEESGLSAQTLRCMTIPPESMAPEEFSHRLYFIDELFKVSVQMRRKLTPTSPMGSILQAILNCQDGHPQCLPEITQRLKSLTQICDYASYPISHLRTTSGPSSTLRMWTCRFCDKAGSTRELLLCSRCKDTYYCSKECQRSDWKAHKPTCQQFGDRPVATGASGRHNLILNWIQRHYLIIMQDLDRTTHLYNVPKRELILELDFFADKQGIVPALCTPNPIFHIGLTQEYLVGDRPAEPDWFFKGTDGYQNNIHAFLITLRDQYQRLTSNHLLAVLRYPSGNFMVHRVQLDSGHGSNKALLSDAALVAFSRVMRSHDDDDDCTWLLLEQEFTPEIVRRFRDFRDQCRRGAGRDPAHQAALANLARQVHAFPNSDLERQVRAEFGSDSDDDKDGS